MKRRELLECAALLIGGATASQAGFSLSSEQKLYISNAPSYIEREANYFSAQQRSLVESLVDIIIPETDTPGAKLAKVAKFVELMVAEWLTEDEKLIFLDGLNGVAALAQARFGQSVSAWDQTALLNILERLEEDASDDVWFALGNSAGAFGEDHKSPFICQLKELTVWGFFTSEVGAKQVLRYNPMPMEFKGDIPLAPDDSSWSGTLDT